MAPGNYFVCLSYINDYTRIFVHEFHLKSNGCVFISNSNFLHDKFATVYSPNMIQIFI